MHDIQTKEMSLLDASAEHALRGRPTYAAQAADKIELILERIIQERETIEQSAEPAQSKQYLLEGKPATHVTSDPSHEVPFRSLRRHLSPRELLIE